MPCEILPVHSQAFPIFWKHLLCNSGISHALHVSNINSVGWKRAPSGPPITERYSKVLICHSQTDIFHCGARSIVHTAQQYYKATIAPRQSQTPLMQGSVYSRYAPSQWETLQCNVFHWLGAHLDWSLPHVSSTLVTCVLPKWVRLGVLTIVWEFIKRKASDLALSWSASEQITFWSWPSGYGTRDIPWIDRNGVQHFKICLYVVTINKRSVDYVSTTHPLVTYWPVKYIPKSVCP